MEIWNSGPKLQRWVLKQRNLGRSIGFVPTMGALHAGHASLIMRAKQECDVVVASVFVNPTQFNDPKDLEKYPRTFEHDRDLLQAVGCNGMFHPSVEAIYPNGTSTETIDLAGLDTTMEGAFRPGHFNGVVQVVGRLFDLTLPDKAYFGEKDYQQLAVIRYMTKATGRAVEVIGCPTVREADGLAMSSRNVRLSAKARQQALAIYQALVWAKNNSDGGTWHTTALDAFERLSLADGVEPEYLNIVDGTTLHTLMDGENPVTAVACVAAKVGGVRLIDNLRLNP